MQVLSHGVAVLEKTQMRGLTAMKASDEIPSSDFRHSSRIEIEWSIWKHRFNLNKNIHPVCCHNEAVKTPRLRVWNDCSRCLIQCPAFLMTWYTCNTYIYMGNYMILIFHNYMISVLQKSLVYGLYIRSQTVCCLRLFLASVVKEVKEGICLARPKNVSILSIFSIPYVLRSYDPPKKQDAEIPHKKVGHLDDRPPGKWYKNPWWP